MILKRNLNNTFAPLKKKINFKMDDYYSEMLN